MADVLKRTTLANVRLTRNELPLYEQEHYKEAITFTESTHQRVVLATSMASPQEFDLSGVATGAVILFQTDRAVKLGIDQDTNLLDIAANGMMMMVGSFTHVYVQNESTTYQATVELVVTD